MKTETKEIYEVVLDQHFESIEQRIEHAMTNMRHYVSIGKLEAATSKSQELTSLLAKLSLLHHINTDIEVRKNHI